VRVQVLWPDTVQPLQPAANDDSLVLRLQSGNESFLLTGDIERAVIETLGKSFRPKTIRWVSDLPRTRSAKIMRRVMRAVVSGEDVGDVTTLEDPGAVDEVRAWLKALKK